MKNKNIGKIFFKTGKIFIIGLFAASIVFGWFFSDIKSTALPAKVLAAGCTAPVDVMLVMDVSGSMADNNKLVTAKEASKNFINKLNLTVALPSGDQVGLVSFNDTATLRNELTQKGNIVKNSIDNLLAGGQTNLQRAIEVGVIELNNVRHNASARKTVVILTDGNPNRPYPEDTAGQAAIAAAADAKNTYGIRIVTIGLELQNLPEAERLALISVLTNVASAPADFFQATDPISLGLIYDTISAALCDSTAPQIVAYSRNPSGTVYSADAIKIKSTASDNIGIKSHLIKWTADNWTTENSSSNADCDVNRNNCSFVIGPFANNTNIKYKIAVKDTNDNATNSAIESFNVASLAITAPNFLRNTDNNVAAAVNDPDGKLIAGGAKFYLSVESPEGSGVYKIDKREMACLGNEFSKSCSYAVNPDCSWTDSSAKIYVYPYDNNYDLNYHNPPATKSVTISNPIEAKTEPGRCSNCLNDDCDAGNKWDLANYNNTSAGCGSTAIYNASLAEPACDNLAPIVAISRVPAGNVFETDTLVLTSVATEIPPGLNILQNHKLWYRVNSGAWINAFNCADSNFDGLCDADTSKNISGFSVNLGQFASGTKIDYYSEATDTAPIPNTGKSSPTFDTVTVSYAECYGQPALTPCTGGKCCGDVCNSVAAYNTNCTLDDQCRQEACSGSAWTCTPANFGSNCSIAGPVGDGCAPYAVTGCEFRDYSCQSNGACNYSITDLKPDGCSDGFLNDYGISGCTGSSCGLPIPPSINCSLAGSVNGCSCSCGGYGKEEKFYSSLSLDGTDDYVNIPKNIYSDNMTLEIWIKPSIINTGFYQGFAGYQGASTFYRPFDLWIGPNNGALFWQTSKSDNTATHGSSINNFFTSAGNWYHIAFVKDANKLTIYKNGIPTFLPDSPFTSIYKPSIFWIGKLDNYFKGSIGEVRVFNRALNSAEINQEFKGNYVNDTDLAGRWIFDGNTNDSSGKGNNGTLNLGTGGNIVPANAWLTARLDPYNVPASWAVCSDTDTFGNAIDNDCDGIANIAEPACDNVFDSLTVGPPGTVYNDLNPVSIISTATDSAGISQHTVKWWIGNNEAMAISKSCPSLNICQIDIGTPYAPFAAGTTIKYKSEAKDNMGNQKIVVGEVVVTSRECLDMFGNVVPDGTPCDYGPGTCFDWLYGTGCEQRNDMCFAGICQAAAFEQKEDRCGDSFGNEKNKLREYGCLSNLCTAGTPTDCSLAGSVNGCVCTCDGFGKEEKFYSALKLDGQDDYINAGNGSRLNVATGNFSVEVWAKSFGYTSAGTIISKQNWFYSGGPGYYIAYPFSPQNIYVGVCDGNNCSVNYHHINTGLGSVFDWTHIAMVKDGYKLKAYINGEKVTTGESNTDNIYGSLSNIKNLIIGKSESGGTFNGLIKGVRFYDRALSSSEVKSHFNGTYLNDGGVAGPAAIWDLDGNTNDSSGNGNNGTLYLGTGGNTNIANAWVSNKTDSNNIPAPWKVCTDKNTDNSDKDNDCDAIANTQEALCDNVPPTVSVSHSSVSGKDYNTEAIALSSTASDAFGIKPGFHKIIWTKDNWATLSTSAPADCSVGVCTVSFPAGTFSPTTVIKYKAEALDNNDNFSSSPEQEFTVHDECFGNTSGSPCSGGGGICCGNFCDKAHWRKPVTISGSAGGIATDYQVKVTAAKELKMKTDYSDVYFTDSDGVAMLPFWRETYNISSATFWVKVPSIPIAPGTKTIYMYYGSPIIDTAGNGAATFNFFDDFTGTSIDVSKWTIVNAAGFSVAGGELKGIDTAGRIRSVPVFSGGNILEIKSRYLSLPVNGYQIGGFYLAANNGFGSLNHPGTNYYRNDSNWIAIGAVLPAATDLLTKISVKSSSAVDLSIDNYATGANYKNYSGLANAVSSEPVVLGKRYDDLLPGQAYEAYWDWVRIRKYISPEPAVAIGAETSTSLTDYLLDSECSQTACSAAIPTVWTWAASNNGVPCSDGANSSGCYIWPTLGSGCEDRVYTCSGGSCAPALSGQSIDSCSGNTFKDYGCGAFCVPLTSHDCSQTGSAAAAYDNSALACNCQCGSYDREEKFYSAINLDGIDDRIDMGDPALLRITDALTVSAWFNRDTDQGNWPRILAKGASPEDYDLELAENTTNRVCFYLGFDNSKTGVCTPNNSVAAGTWYHVAGVRENNKMYIYLNGVLPDNNSKNENIFAGAIDSNSGNFNIGRQVTGSYFKGKIKEARVYSRALPAQEILQQANGEYLNNTGLAGAWALDGTANDSSGNSLNGALNLGTLGNTVSDIAWKSTRANANNVPSPWRMCTDTKNNDCDAFGKIDAAELACDGQAPIVTLEARDNVGNIIANGATLYDINIDEASEKLSFTSLASDPTPSFGISQHKFRWTTNNWVVTNEVDCLGGICNPYNIFGTNFSALPKPITVKYYAEAWDNNGNSACNPVGCQASANNFSIVAFNTPPVVTPVSIIQSGDYCVGGPQLTVKWNYFDNEGNAQKAYQVEIADNPSFTAPYTSSVFSSASTTFTLSTGLNYNSTYYWRVKVWDNSSISMASLGSGGVCGEWKCDLNQFITTPLHAYPSVNFGWLPESPKVSEEVQFNNTSTPVAGVTWEWDLNSPSNKCGSPSYHVTSGPGGNSDNTTDWNPVYIYSDPTYFAIGLKITDSAGYACEIQKCISIGKKPPRWKEIIPK